MNSAVNTATRRMPASIAWPTGVLTYYEETAGDFDPWSQNGNMHFGYCTGDMSPFERELQLAQMNREVGHRLAIPADDIARIVDLGCGTGASLRQLLGENPGWHAVGLNVVADQIEAARKMALADRLNSRSTYLCENYTATSFPTGRFDGALAIESSCYGTGYSKTDFLREAKRLLRPGARLVVADFFLRDSNPLPPFIETCHHQMCQSWALGTLAQKPAFEQALRDVGFVDTHFEDISLNVMPSALHVPGVTTRYLLQLFRQPATATAARRGHALAPLFALMLATARSRFGYFLVTATRG